MTAPVRRGRASDSCSTSDLLVQLAWEIPCGFCGVQQFEPCVTKAGSPLNEGEMFHTRRTQPLREAWLRGQRDAQHEAKVRGVQAAREARRQRAGL